MSDSWVTFVSLLLESKNPSYQQYVTVASSLVHHASQIRTIFRRESTTDSIFLHLDRVIIRLEELFRILNVEDVTEELADAVCQGLFLPLLQKQDNIASLEQVTRIAGSLLPIILIYPSFNLKLIVKSVLQVDGLLERLVAHEKYSDVIKDKLTLKNTFLDRDTRESLTERLIQMCNECSADHGISSTLKRWSDAKSLRKALTEVLGSLQQDEKEKNEKTRDLPLLAGMTKLDVDDKKTSRARRQTAPQFEISPEITNCVASLGLPKPESLRGIQLLLSQLEDDMMHSIMCSALHTFPCRCCIERLTGPPSSSSSVRTSVIVPGHHDLDIKHDIFGKRVGLWKVLLSDRALKDMNKFSRSGLFVRLEQKIRELASGDWKGKDLSTRAGSRQQREEMRIPVLQAKLTAKLFLLWQIDVGFYEENSSMMQQLVKVWKIVTTEELPNSIGHIILVQQTYDPGTAKICCERPLQQTDGRFLPRQFPDLKNARYPIFSTTNSVEKEISKNLLDMTNKFYTLTEPIIRSLAAPTGSEEFPLNLSKDEMEIVGHFKTSSLILGRSGTGKTTCLVFKILAKYRAQLLVPDERPIRQLLLTRSNYLAAKLQTYTRSLIESQLQKNLFATNDTSRDVDSLKLNAYGQENVSSLLSLRDNDFPFVCTFDSFLQRLENTIRRADRKDFLQDEHALTRSERRRMVDFNIFKTEYWEHFATNLTSSCSAELVFSEIMGVIKGSISSAETMKPLSREEYLQTSCRLAPAFTSESERERVYTAFERYEKLKKQRAETDDMDRVITVLTSLKQTPGLGRLISQCFEEIYVDEVQDLRCLDIMLLLHCVCDARGIHLAGDTAQCISKDSVFRFSEIKALLHDYYATVARESGQSELARPVQFSLSRNYRSHQGILSLASFVMQLLWTGFPDTIDKLDPEIGQLGGPRPIIFAGFDAEILSAKMIGLVKLHDRIADFGAEQAILVRDDASKAMLQKRIGEMALVLTILESKGMEFDDVLLYDFFSGSGLGNSYRSLSHLAYGRNNLFDAQKHAALCSELKHLYVAVTRARRQLWLLESSEKNVQPVIGCLTEGTTLSLVDVVRPKDPNVADKVKVLRAGGSVDPERWFKRGVYLLHQKNFSDALLCFKKANNKKGITQCQAYLHDQEARTCRSRNDLDGFTANLQKAIHLFLLIGFISEASDCLENLGEYQKAAEIWKSEKQYERAAYLFEKAALFVDASACYHLNRSYEAAVEVLRRGDQFDEMIQYLSQNHEKISESVLRRYSRLCNILLKQGRVSTELQRQTINMLGSNQEKESFFKEFEMAEELCDLYRSEQRFRELYYLLLEAGDLLPALDVVLTQNLWGAVDLNEIEMIFHYTQAGKVYSERMINKIEDHTFFFSRDTIEATPLANLALEWEKARSFLASVDDLDANFDLSFINSNLIKDFVCLFMVAFEKNMMTRSRLTGLPTEVLHRTVYLVQKLASDDTTSRSSLFLLCSIFIMPSRTDKPMMLYWQPLDLAEELNIKTYHTVTELCGRAKYWICKKLSNAVERFEESAGSLWRQEFPQRCFHFLTKGYCHRQRNNQCSYLHEITDVQHHSTKILSVLQICSVYAGMLGLYLQREVMGEEFQTKYLGRRRRWLERLIEELTFVTSFDQAPSAMILGEHHILTDPKYATITSCLEDLLFHRLSREWNERSTFTAILEQVQLAHLLGPHATARFFRALSKKVGGCRSAAFHGVRAAEKIQSAAANQEFRDFCFGVETFVQSVLRQLDDMEQFSSFQAALNVFEFAATYLLCMVNPGHAIAIPSSWAMLYLPRFIHHSVPAISPDNEQQQFIYGNCLLSLINCFCTLMDRLEWAMQYYTITFNCAGRRNLQLLAIRQRNTDFLSVIALNLGSANVPIRGFSEAWRKIQKVLTFSAPPGLVQQITLQNLQREFTRSFEIYNGKDLLHVITLNDADVCPLYLRGFIVNGATLVKLSTIMKASLKYQQATTINGTDDDDTDVENYTAEKESKMVTMLQRRWRRILPRIRSARESRQTPQGIAIESLFKLCASSLPSKLHSSVKIAVRAILFTDGVRILMELDSLSSRIRKLNATWKSLFESTTSTTQLELLSSVRTNIMECESAARHLRRAWSMEALIDSTLFSCPRELEECANHALRTLRIVWHELENIMQNLVNLVKHA